MLEWNDWYATGVEKIDRQHKRLFKIINDLEEAVLGETAEATFEEALKFLGNYVASHFSCEESCMHKMRCPVAETNKDAHTKFLQVYESFVNRFQSDGYSNAIAKELLNMTQDWLIEHICGVDIRMQSCIGAT